MPQYTHRDTATEITPYQERIGKLLKASHTRFDDRDIADWVSSRERSLSGTDMTEVAVFDGRDAPVGYGATFYPPPLREQRYGILCYLTVAGAHRRQGLARFMIAHRMQVGRNCPDISGLVVQQLTAENHLTSYYEQLGFYSDPTERFALVWSRPVIVRGGQTQSS